MHVIDDIGQPNFHGGPCDSDGAYEQSHLWFLIGKHMFNARSEDGLARIGSLNMTGHGLEIRLLAMAL